MVILTSMCKGSTNSTTLPQALMLFIEPWMKAISKRGFEVEDEMKKTPSPEDWPKHAKSDSSPKRDL